MPTSRIAVRLLTLLFLLAGILLLQKPVFGESIPAAPTLFAVVIQGPPCAATTPAINRVCNNPSTSNNHRK